MARHRRDTQESGMSAVQRPLRVVASGTLFLTHTLSLPTHPEPSSVIRASSVTRLRGGSASTCLSILAQFPAVEAMLVAPLGGNEDGQRIIRDLEKERVSTRFCKVREGAGVPSAWVLHADDTDTQIVINNNPLPDITHEEFVSLLGPLLAPENYAYPAASLAHTANHLSAAHNPTVNNPPALQPRTSTSNMHAPSAAPVRSVINSPAPFDWVHFEGRSVKTTLSNIMGLDGLARERKWRSHCVFSVDVGRRARQGVEALVPYADVLFLNKHYARAHSPQYAASPRAFLLSLTALASPHALLVAHWGEEGAALLSVPTREYFQSSGWMGADSRTSPTETSTQSINRVIAQEGNCRTHDEIISVRTDSDFWAGQHTDSSSVFTAGLLSTPASSSSPMPPEPQGARIHEPSAVRGQRKHASDDDSSDSDGTQVAPGRDRSNAPERGSDGVVDEVGAQDAFMAGMMFALSRRILPGEPYAPSTGGRRVGDTTEVEQKSKWRLEECLRFATELAGRKARRKGWDGLADEMARAGWFEAP